MAEFGKPEPATISELRLRLQALIEQADPLFLMDLAYWLLTEKDAEGERAWLRS